MFINIYKLLIVLFFISFASYNATSEDKIEHKISVLVNEQAITSYDIIQRLKLMAIIQGINLNAQNTQLLVNNVVDELIREKVKLSKINEYQIEIKNEEYKEFEINFFYLKSTSISSSKN